MERGYRHECSLLYHFSQPGLKMQIEHYSAACVVKSQVKCTINNVSLVGDVYTISLATNFILGSTWLYCFSQNTNLMYAVVFA